MAHSEFMAMALDEARLAFEKGEVPVGAVIVKGGEVISRAHNLTEGENTALAHAELIAIHRAAEALGDWRLSGCTLYVTLEPCLMCTGAILNSRLDEVVFGAYDEEMGCCGSRLDMSSALPRKTKMVGGIMEEECKAILAEFFEKRRRR